MPENQQLYFSIQVSPSICKKFFNKLSRYLIRSKEFDFCLFLLITFFL